MLDWDDLRYLDALARTRSVTRAARELGVSVSTVYRRVSVIEAVTGGPCLVRGLGRAALTDSGRALARVGSHTRESLHRALAAARAPEAHVAGTVSLTTVEGVFPFLVEPIARLAVQHPELRVTIHVADSGPSVRKREVDVAVGVMRRPPEGCWGRRVLRIEYGVFGTREALARRPRPRWIVLGAPLDRGEEAAWERLHADDVAVATGSRSAFVGFVRAGVGIGLLPRVIARRDASLVECDDYRASAAGLARVAWVLTHPDLRKTPRVVALMAALTDALQALAPMA